MYTFGVADTVPVVVIFQSNKVPAVNDAPAATLQVQGPVPPPVIVQVAAVENEPPPVSARRVTTTLLPVPGSALKRT
jgi:hypothetical protein